MVDTIHSTVPHDVLLPVLEALPVGVWIMDQAGRITYGNPAAREIWGGSRYVGPEQFVEYKGWWPGSNTPIAPDAWAAARAIAKGETSIDEVVEIECFDGRRKTILNSALPLRAADGTIAGAIILNQDITDRHKAEVERDDLIRQLQTAVAEVHTLSGLLPICASCKKIRDGANQWHSIESYIADRSTAQFSHGICPECMNRLYPEGRAHRDQNKPAEH